MLRQQEVDRRRQAEPLARRLHRAARERRAPTTSARSRSPPASAPTSWRAASSASTTTTTRSWSRRSPIGSPRRSPSTCTRRRAQDWGIDETRDAPTTIARREVPRHPPGVRLSGVPRSQREVQAVRPARRARASASTLTENAAMTAGGERQRPVLRASAGAVLHRRPHRRGSDRQLRAAQGAVDRAGRALADAEPRVRAGALLIGSGVVRRAAVLRFAPY